VNKELESFSYSVSHDLSAPLRVIGGYARILKDEYAPEMNKEAADVVNNIMVNARKMGQLINDLLLFSHTGKKNW
jgi:light-regulated signal transduction histidine kinase (bacteriophytochrome)